MVTEDAIRREIKNGAGTTGPFTFSFRVRNSEDVMVTLFPPNNAPSQLLVAGIDYSIALSGSGGDITTTAAVVVGAQLVIEGNTPYTQDIDYINNDPFPAETNEAGLDKLTELAQQNRDSIQRALLLPSNTPVTGISFPEPSAGEFIRWNAAETGLENAEIVSSGVIGVPVPVNQGGTGAVTGPLARDNLGIGLASDNVWTGDHRFNGAFRIGNGTELTLDAAGLIVPTGAEHSVDTFGGAAADDLESISAANLGRGSILILRPESTARLVTVRQGSNIQLANGQDFTLRRLTDRLVLRKDSNDIWRELCRSTVPTPVWTDGPLVDLTSAGLIANVLTDLPADVREIEFEMIGASHVGSTAAWLLFLGTAGGLVTSGYVNRIASLENSVLPTTAFLTASFPLSVPILSDAANIFSLTTRLTKGTGNAWTFTMSGQDEATARKVDAFGRVDTVDPLTFLQITASGVAFDAGTVQGRYR